MDLVICSTPYQIFTAINLKCSEILSSDSDLIVFDYAAGIETVCDRLKKENLFSCVRLSKTKDYFAKCTSGKVKGFLWTGYYLLLKKRFVERIAYIKKYDRIFYSFADPSIVIICDYFRKSYGDIEFIGFEDGLSNYYNRQNTYIQKNICRYFHVDKSIYFRKKTYMYCPELAPDPNGEYSLTKIPPVFRTEHCRNILNRVFGWTSECKISERVVYFDQLPHYRVGATDDFNKNMTKILKDQFGNNLIVKTHPRRTDNIYEEAAVNVYKYNSIPFELCCMNSALDDSVFITNISSACFMPKMIFGLEPKLVFLFRLEHKKNDKPISDFLQRFTDSYSDKSRIYFPESVEDLKRIIEEI